MDHRSRNPPTGCRRDSPISSSLFSHGPPLCAVGEELANRLGALPFFSTLMPMSSSAAVNALVNPGSSGYRCRLRRNFGCLFGALPVSRSWCVT